MQIDLSLFVCLFDEPNVGRIYGWLLTGHRVFFCHLCIMLCFQILDDESGSFHCINIDFPSIFFLSSDLFFYILFKILLLSSYSIAYPFNCPFFFLFEKNSSQPHQHFQEYFQCFHWNKKYKQFLPSLKHFLIAAGNGILDWGRL